MDSTQPSPPGTPYRPADTLGVLRHQWWVVVLGTLLGVAAAGGWGQLQQPVWESSTSVLVHPVGRDINVVGGRTQGQVNLDTEAQLVRSTAVAAGAAGLLGAGAGLPEELARQVSVEVPPNTSVLVITFSGPTPAVARAGSHAFAEAYLRQREDSARAELAAQTSAIEAQTEEVTGTLGQINERLAAEVPGSAAAANLESQRTTVTNQLSALTSRLDELTTATVTAGTVISEARLPSRPSRPRPAIVLASGAALGIVLGMAGAALAERLARRVHRPVDVERRVGVPVVANFTPATAPRRDELAPLHGAAGSGRGGTWGDFDRLRNEVIAMTGTTGPDSGGAVIVVTSATTGPAASLTAANLAASLARSGHEVVLVGARGPLDAGGRMLPSLLGIAAGPGLSEVLAGRLLVGEALQRPARHPRLQVLTMGATATATAATTTATANATAIAAGLLQSPALRSALATLAQRASYVVVDAPPTPASADAQSLASHADAALVVVELRRARLADLADAVEQVRRVGTPVIGAVVVPPMRGERAPGRDPEQDPEPAPATARQEPATPPPPPRLRPASARPAPQRPHRQVGPAAPGPRTVTAPAAGTHSAAPPAAGPSGTDPDGQTIVLPRVLGGDETV